MGTKTKPLLKKDTGQELKPNYPVKQEIDSTCIPETKNNHIFLKLFFEHPLSVGIIAAVVGDIIATVVGTIILKRIYP